MPFVLSLSKDLCRASLSFWLSGSAASRVPFTLGIIMTEKSKQNLKVYYNSACPVCKAGIDSQRGKMQDGAVDWNDIHCDIEARGDLDADVEFVRERLHVVDAQGNVHVGMRAFAAIWAQSPGEAWKARLVNLPVIKPLADWGYNGFARALYRWNRRKAHW